LLTDRQTNNDENKHDLLGGGKMTDEVCVLLVRVQHWRIELVPCHTCDFVARLWRATL